MTRFRDTENECKKISVPYCAIQDKVTKKQAEYLEQTGRYLSIPRAIVQLILEK
jgi:hypothetical protein